MRTLCTTLAAFCALTSTALAMEDEPQCMAPLAITAELVAQAGHYQFSGYEGSGAIPAFLVGSLSSSRDTEDRDEFFGAVVFVRGADGWRAFMPMNGEDVVAVYAGEGGAIMLATMWTTEGPGQSWTLLRSSDGLATGACTQVAFPATLNEPWANEFLDLTDFDINARGRGEIISVANTEARGDLWYRYSTRDHGATWSAPQRLSRQREARGGVYRRIMSEEAPASPALVADLTSYARAQ